NQTICLGSSTESVVWNYIGDITAIDVFGQPDGIVAVVDTTNKTLTISGTPVAVGSSDYWVVTEAAVCDPIFDLFASLTVNEPSAIVLTSGEQAQTLCLGSALDTVVYTFGGSATNVAVTDLPIGLSANVNTGEKT